MRQLILGLLLLFDAYLGLIHSAGSIVWSGVFTGQIKWLLLSVEMMVGGFLLLRTLINQVKPRWKNVVVISAPILVVLIAFCVLELALTVLN